LTEYGARRGAWALVTGATDGIGREFARQLANAGFNVVLVSRSTEKLAAAASEIETKYKVSSKIYTIDLLRPTPRRLTALRKLSMGLLSAFLSIMLADLMKCPYISMRLNNKRSTTFCKSTSIRLFA